MFWLGILSGLAIALAAVWLLYGPDGALRISPPSASSRVLDVERQAIDQMLAAEFAARQFSDQDPSEVVEGEAREVVRRP